MVRSDKTMDNVVTNWEIRPIANATEKLAAMLAGESPPPPVYVYGTPPPTLEDAFAVTGEPRNENPPESETGGNAPAEAAGGENPPPDTPAEAKEREAEKVKEVNRRMQLHKQHSTCVDAADWLAQEDPPDDPIICGLIERGEMFALVGQSKAGKSLLALQMALCVAAGRDFLGRRTVHKRVYVANLEVSANQYRKRLRSTCKALGIQLDELRGWLFVDNMKGSDVTWEWLRDEAIIRGTEVVLIDPFYQVFKGAETNELDCLEAVAEMKKFQRDGFTLIIVFHSPKGFSGDRQLIDMISGSSVLARFPESIIGVLSHATEKGGRVIDCELRNYAKPDPFAVKFADGAFVLANDLSADVKSSSGRVINFKSPEERKRDKAATYDNEQATLRAALASILEEAGDNLLSSAQLHSRIMEKTHIGKHNVNDFLKARKDDGDIVSTYELVEEGERRGTKKKGGKVFVSTPDRIKAYNDKFCRLPF